MGVWMWLACVCCHRDVPTLVGGVVLLGTSHLYAKISTTRPNNHLLGLANYHVKEATVC